METIYLNAKNLKYWQVESSPNVIALGFFDGVHKGHQEVIRTAANHAKERGLALTVMSFFPHPKTVLSNGKEVFDYLMPLSEKANVLQTLGVDRFYIVEFDKAFASLSPEDFIANYLLDFNTTHAVAGFDFSYGYRGTGNIDRMQADSGGRLQVTKVDKVEHFGRKISSTWMREMLQEGNFEELTTILGRFYETTGKWDGGSLELFPYYGLPAAGCYTATIKMKNNTFLTNIVVEEGMRKIRIATDLTKEIPLGEQVTIIWRKRVKEGAVYAYSS